jgi:hypothetical protein
MSESGSAATTVVSIPDLLAEAKSLRDQIYYGAPLGSEVERLANRLGRVLFEIETNLWEWKRAKRPLTGQAP